VPLRKIFQSFNFAHRGLIDRPIPTLFQETVMRKKGVLLALAVVLILAFAPFGFAQLGTEALSPHRVLGYFNADTGLFEPLRPAAEDTDLPPVAATTGTLVYNFTITLKSALPKNGVITCSASGAVIETKFSADEAGFGIAKLVSGTTYSCNVSMPYSWLLATPTSDKIILSYKAQVNEGIEFTASNGTATSVVLSTGRASSQTTASIPVPASGATTTENVSVTL
jgi:hypothetical protein